MTHDENRISDLIDGGLHDKSAIDRAKYELHMRQRAVIEEAAKLPTAYQTLNHHLSRVGLTLVTAHESILLDAIESHTAAHTEGLREENERLKKLIFEIRRGMMVGISFGIPNTACQEYLDNINRIVGAPK